VREIVRHKMIQLGHDKWARSDVIIAVEPITGKFFNTDQNGNKMRSRVLINHAEGEILASRTADTILKSMTKQEGVDREIPNFLNMERAQSRKNYPHGMLDVNNDKDAVIHALVHCQTVSDAIAESPFGRSKFYRLVKKHGIDTKPYLESTDDPDMFLDQVSDDGLA